MEAFVFLDDALSMAAANYSGTANTSPAAVDVVVAAIPNCEALLQQMATNLYR